MPPSNPHPRPPKTCIYVFGNPDLEIDSLPLKILPTLQKQLPAIKFITVDPNEEAEYPAKLIILDTALGVNQITVFDGLESFSAAPHLSLHDFDALANLHLLQKLGKIKTVKIIGLPMGLEKKMTLPDIADRVISACSSLD